LYLLNPSGVLFGPNASLEISGSFHVSTADYLRLADGARFSARLSDTSTLSVAPPEAFGFLGPHPASIAVQGSALHVPAGAALSLVGGDIKITGSSPTDFDNPTLAAPGGRVLLTSVTAPGEVQLAAMGQPLPSDVSAFDRLGTMVIEHGALIDASGNGGGTVSIRGGRLQVENAFVFADTKPGGLPGAALGIDMHVTGEVVVTNGSFITSDALGAGNAGEMRIAAGSLQLAASFIGSRSAEAGHAGTVDVTAQNIAITDGAQIASVTFGPGPGGAVRVAATDTLTLTGTAPGAAFPSGILASAQGRVVGAGAGTVVAEARTVTLADGAQIASATFGPGPGRTVTVTATEAISISGQDKAGNPSALLSNAFGQGSSAGRAGDLFVSAPVLHMEGGRIVARTEGDGNAGNITVQVGQLELAEGAQIFNGTGSREITNGMPIFVGTGGPGQGGTLTVNARESITIAGRSPQGFRSGLFSNAQFGTGRAGDLSVTTPTLELRNQGTLQSLTTDRGDAGNIVVNVGKLVLKDGGQIDSGADIGSTGRGGTVTVTATEAIAITGRDRMRG
jgi:large exoprotein involved in heme utilization and adhesion